MKKMKRLFAGLLAVVMLAMATPVYAAPIKAENAIIDLSQEEIIDLLGGLDIIEGYEDGEFHGERNVARAEMAKNNLISSNLRNYRNAIAQTPDALDRQMIKQQYNQTNKWIGDIHQADMYRT